MLHRDPRGRPIDRIRTGGRATQVAALLNGRGIDGAGRRSSAGAERWRAEPGAWVTSTYRLQSIVSLPVLEGPRRRRACPATQTGSFRSMTTPVYAVPMTSSPPVTAPTSRSNTADSAPSRPMRRPSRSPPSLGGGRRSAAIPPRDPRQVADGRRIPAPASTTRPAAAAKAPSAPTIIRAMRRITAIAALAAALALGACGDDDETTAPAATQDQTATQTTTTTTVTSTTSGETRQRRRAPRIPAPVPPTRGSAADPGGSGDDDSGGGY